jgi:hypothetical protein
MSDLDFGLFTHQKEGSCYNAPFSLVDRSNKPWDVATDRAMFLAIRRKPQFPRFQGPGAEMFQMLGWLHGEPEKPLDIVVEDLQRWIGPSPKGCGVILGVAVDLVRLDRLLRTAPLKKVNLWQAKKLVGDPRCIAMEVKDRWRVLLMGHDKAEPEYPSLDLGGSEPVFFDEG